MDNQILELLQKHPRGLRLRGIAAALHYSRSALILKVQDLEQRNLIEYQIINKRAYWRIKH